MAHVGKRYKLQFRRDLALNVVNRDAYPEGAFLSVASLGGVVGDRIQQNDIIVANLLTDAQPPMVWTSGIVVVSSVPFHAQVTLDGFNGIDKPFGRLKIIREITGAILFDSGESVSRQDGPPFNCGWQCGVPPTQTALCHILGATFAFGMMAAEWVDYNP